MVLIPKKSPRTRLEYYHQNGKKNTWSLTSVIGLCTLTWTIRLFVSVSLNQVLKVFEFFVLIYVKVKRRRSSSPVRVILPIKNCCTSHQTCLDLSQSQCGKFKFQVISRSSGCFLSQILNHRKKVVHVVYPVYFKFKEWNTYTMKYTLMRFNCESAWSPRTFKAWSKLNLWFFVFEFCANHCSRPNEVHLAVNCN